MRKFCAKNYCEIVIIPHNLMNIFQRLDISVNKAGKSFISDKFNAWVANEMSKQLRAGKTTADVKVSLKLSVIKPLMRSGLSICATLLKITRKWQKMVSGVQGLLKLSRMSEIW